jgi:hypothetical protein
LLFGFALGVEADVLGVSGGYAQGLDDEAGADRLERAFYQAVDYVHERELDGFAVFEQGHGMELHIDAQLHAFDDAGVEIAEKFAAQSGGAALLSGDFDVGAVADVGTFG